MRAIMNTNCFSGDLTDLNPDVLAILQYNTTEITIPNTTTWDATMDATCQDLNLTELVPLQSETVPTSDVFVRIDVTFQTKAADLNFGFMNSTSWVPLNGSDILSQVGFANGGNYSVAGVDSTDFSSASQLVYSVPTIQTIEYFILCAVANASLLINNLDEGTHPFHLHGHKFWVLAQGDGVYKPSTPLAPTPVFRDTVSVGIPPFDDRSDNRGIWFHVDQVYR